MIAVFAPLAVKTSVAAIVRSEVAPVVRAKIVAAVIDGRVKPFVEVSETSSSGVDPPISPPKLYVPAVAVKS